jgi:hypothetical protein
MKRKNSRKRNGEMHPATGLARRREREATVEPVPRYSPLAAAIMAATPASMPPG